MKSRARASLIEDRSSLIDYSPIFSSVVVPAARTVLIRDLFLK